jgi:hypothetical protein
VASEEEVISEEEEALAARDNWGVLPSCIGCLETIGESTGDMATYVFNVCSCSPCLKAAYDMTTLVVL